MKYCLITSIVLLVACSKKENNSPLPSPSPIPPPGASMRIKTETFGTNVRSYTYDAQGRALKVESSSGSKKEYEYATGLVTRKYFNTAGTFQYADTEELNADGYSNRSIRSDHPTWETLYTYNADKYLTKQLGKSTSNVVWDYFWSNGNMDSARLSSQNGTWFYTVVKTYYTDKPNVLGNAAFGEEYWGKTNKNLVKSGIHRYPDGSTGASETSTYEHDTYGRVTKRTSTLSNGNIEITEYTYY